MTEAELAGVTSDTDGRIRARNSLEEITLSERQGDLDPGHYVLLRYLDPPWQGFYDVFKVINETLLIGRVYLGEFPHGIRQFTFPMTRVYAYDQMTVEDHRDLWQSAAPPSPARGRGRVAHGRDLECEPGGRDRLARVRPQARRPGPGTLPSHGPDGGLCHAVLPVRPFPAG